MAGKREGLGGHIMQIYRVYNEIALNFSKNTFKLCFSRAKMINTVLH